MDDARFEIVSICSIAWSSAKLEKIFKEHQEELKNTNENPHLQRAQREERLSALSSQLRVANVLPPEFQEHSIVDAHRRADYFYTAPSSPQKADRGDCNASDHTEPNTDGAIQAEEQTEPDVHDNEKTSPTSRNAETADVGASQPIEGESPPQTNPRMASLNIGDPWVELMECMKNRFVISVLVSLSIDLCVHINAVLLEDRSTNRP